VLSVPVGAIVALKTGMFADGRVEIEGDAISEGMLVGVPK
jgi:hypothetical protein